MTYIEQAREIGIAAEQIAQNCNELPETPAHDELQKLAGLVRELGYLLAGHMRTPVDTDDGHPAHA